MKGQELKSRIQGVQETVKITKAMQMISASKMPKAQLIFDSSRKYLEYVEKAIAPLMTPENAEHPYFQQRKGDKVAFIVIASDKGLCGDFNSIILEEAYQSIQSMNAVNIFAIGHIAKEYFRKKHLSVSNAYIHFMQDTMPEDARAIADDLIERFNQEEMDKVYIAYTQVKTLVSHKTVIKRILPVEYKESKEDISVLTSQNTVSGMLSGYIWAEIYFALASSSLAINYKRMIAMQQSTTNGEDMIDQLRLEYNHKRQEGITTELMDTVASLQGKRL